MTFDESVSFLNELALKWTKLNDEDKEKYENLVKKNKKEEKKDIKKFLKVKNLSYFKIINSIVLNIC
jgi:hypothetical protein